jgi:hypothetical protein
MTFTAKCKKRLSEFRVDEGLFVELLEGCGNDNVDAIGALAGIGRFSLTTFCRLQASAGTMNDAEVEAARVRNSVK